MTVNERGAGALRNRGAEVKDLLRSTFSDRTRGHNWTERGRR